MRKITLLILLTYFSLPFLQAQIGIDLLEARFNEIPAMSAEDDTLLSQNGALGLSYRVVWDYRMDQNGRIELWIYKHSMVKVQSDESINEEKKLFLGSIKPENIIEAKGRLIKPGGEIVLLDKDDIAEITSDEAEIEEKTDNKNIVSGLQFEDAASGDIIEFYFIYKSAWIPESSRILLQDVYPYKKMEFTLILPQYLKAELRSYNGLPDATDTLVESKRLRYAYIKDTLNDGLKDEPVSFYVANMKAVDFVLAYNLSRNSNRLNTFSGYGNTLFNNISAASKADLKAIKKFSGNIGIDKTMTEYEKVRTIERYVKSNIDFINVNHPDLYETEKVIKNGFGNTLGLTRLYYQLFTYFKIEYELVMTSNKTRIKFDPTFDATNNLDELLFYFPSFKEYLSPDWIYYRVGITPQSVTGQEAVYYEPITVGKVTTLLAEVKDIPLLPMEKSADSIQVFVRMNPENEMVEGNIQRAINGYSSIGIQNNFPDFKPEELEYLIEHYLAFGSENNVVSNEEFFNYSPEDIGVKSFHMKGNFSSSVLADFKPGEIVLSAGSLIGPQSELKEESSRKLPIEISYKRMYHRVIQIEVPEGYECTDLKNIETNVYDTESKQSAKAGFEVSAIQKGNNIEIRCYEYYDNVYYPVSDFQKYQRVVNAAFDFNKVKLTFRKK